MARIEGVVTRLETLGQAGLEGVEVRLGVLVDLPGEGLTERELTARVMPSRLLQLQPGASVWLQQTPGGLAPVWQDVPVTPARRRSRILGCLVPVVTLLGLAGGFLPFVASDLFGVDGVVTVMDTASRRCEAGGTLVLTGVRERAEGPSVVAEAGCVVVIDSSRLEGDPVVLATGPGVKVQVNDSKLRGAQVAVSLQGAGSALWVAGGSEVEAPVAVEMADDAQVYVIHGEVSGVEVGVRAGAGARLTVNADGEVRGREAAVLGPRAAVLVDGGTLWGEATGIVIEDGQVMVLGPKSRVGGEEVAVRARGEVDVRVQEGSEVRGEVVRGQ